MLNTRNEKKHTIKTIVQQRGITKLVHFTSMNNLDTILQYGLATREVLDNTAEDYPDGFHFDFNDTERLERQRDSISLSIHHPNHKMFWKCRSRKPESSWVVLEINPSVLWEEECFFCQTNVASSSETRKLANSRNSVMAFEQMFTPEGRGDNLHSYDPTDVQAEVLLFKDILSVDKILRITTKSVQDCERLKQQYPKHQSLFAVCSSYFLSRDDVRVNPKGLIFPEFPVHQGLTVA